MKRRSDTIDMVGKKFAKLTVLKWVEDKKTRGAKWECICDCGNITIATGGHLRVGARKSCGCLATNRLEQTGINRLYAFYKRKAVKRKMLFSLSWSDFEKLVKGNCYYCGTPPSQVLKRLKNKQVQFIYNGIDRVDPLGYYEINNCVSSCHNCNIAKHTLAQADFFEHIRRICKWHKIAF